MSYTRRGVLGGSVALALPGIARAQADAFPSKPLRMIVPFSPGGPIDILGRPVADRMSKILGQPVIIDNRPGANGIVGTQIVATAPPDGHTLLLTTGSFIGNIFFSPNPLPYDPMRDIAPVTLVGGGTGMLLVGRPGLPAKTMAELVALARSKPDALTIANSGIGNITHLGAEQFQEFTGAKLLQVTLHGTMPALTDMMAGNVDLNFSTVPPAFPFIREGRLRAFGYTGLRRPYVLPDVPTMKELGFPEWELIGMIGLWTTGGTPPERIARIQQAVREAVNQPDIAKLYRDGEFDPSGMPAAEFAAYLEKERAMQQGIAQRAGMQRR